MVAPPAHDRLKSAIPAPPAIRVNAGEPLHARHAPHRHRRRRLDRQNHAAAAKQFRYCAGAAGAGAGAIS